MARFSGMDGSVTFPAGNLHKVKQWSISEETEVGKTIGFDDGSFKEALTGATEWNGSITADFDDEQSVPATGTRGTATLQAKTGKTWSGTIVLTTIENEVEKGSGEPVELTFGFEGSGTLTRPT